jgi:hypothetical protein
MRFYPRTVFTVRASKNQSARMQPSVRANTTRPGGRKCIRADIGASARTRAVVCTDALPASLPRKFNLIYFILLFIIYYLLLLWAGKENFFFRFSVFNPQDPQALWAKPREEGFFGLVPLVTHLSSILFLGGLTPKFLSLSFHSL